jgi:NADH dehydrogenase
VIERLAGAGYEPRIAARHPAANRYADSDAGTEELCCDVRDPDAVARALDGADGAVNAVGLYVESDRDRFEAVHVDGARCVARQAAAGNLRLVHVSGIGVDLASPSLYIRARARGEQAVREANPRTIILRPSALFGCGDAFLGSLARMLRMLPVVPLFGNGTTRLQPVHVDDVAAAVERLFQRPSGPRIYELGGPRIYTYRELLELISAAGRHRRLLLPLPFAAWDLLARLAAILPQPPLTRDQVALMRRDNVVAANAAGFDGLGICPRPLEAEVSRRFKSSA